MPAPGWGHIGANRWDRFGSGGGVAHSPRCGVQRTVEDDVSYVLPADLRFGSPAWSPTPNPRVFEMDLGTEDPPSPGRGYGTLQSLAASLREDLARRGPIDRKDPRLQLLDWLADQFCWRLTICTSTG